jgi:hypothetical protein
MTEAPHALGVVAGDCLHCLPESRVKPPAHRPTLTLLRQQDAGQPARWMAINSNLYTEREYKDVQDTENIKSRGHLHEEKQEAVLQGLDIQPRIRRNAMLCHAQNCPATEHAMLFRPVQ